MASSSLSRRSNTSSGPVLSSSYSSTGFASSSSRFSSSTVTSTRTATSSCFDHNHRSSSPTRVNLYSFSNGLSSSSSIHAASSSSTGYSSRSVAVKSANSSASQHHNQNKVPSSTNQQKRTCMCSPTNHPGSFRCSLHKNSNASSKNNYPSNNQRLSARRSAMTNSLVRISTVEGDLVKRALASLIRPSSHNQRRRSGFQPRPSRLSVMSR